jgi:NADH dehydrogenase
MQRTGDGRRAGLIREARAFLIYTLRSRPAPVLVRRYVRSVEQLRNRHALDLPGFSQSMPTLLALLDDPALRSAPNGPEFIWRLNAAVVLGEASPQGARRYLGLGASHGVVVDGLRMVWAVAAEITWRVARVCLRPLLRQTLRRSGL